MTSKEYALRYAIRCIRSDLDNARDNLHRARAAAKSCDPSQQWGQSGQTLNEIIADYEFWEMRAAAALAEIEGMKASAHCGKLAAS